MMARPRNSHGVLTLALLVCATALACGPPTPTVVEHAPPSCSEETLTSLDPGVPVMQARRLATISQERSATTEHFAVVPCEDGEPDADCAERAEARARASYPKAEELDTQIGFERMLLRAEVRVGGALHSLEADGLAALSAQHAELGGTTHAQLASLRAVPAPGAKRVALLRALVPGQHDLREALRLQLVLAPPDDPVGTLLRLQRVAARAGVHVQHVEQRDDGAIAAELSCVRSVDEASKTDLPSSNLQGGASGNKTFQK